MKLSQIHPNPNNPRLIKDDRFKKLCQSIKEFPKMMALRPIIVDKEGMILGGNMRFKALQALGYKDIPDEWVKRDSEMTEAEKQRFIVTDNVPFGDWDLDILQEWDKAELLSWGLELPEVLPAAGGADPFNDVGITAQDKYGVIVECDSAGAQESIFNDLQGMGYKCKILVV